jgi:hypothetical protein
LDCLLRRFAPLRPLNKAEHEGIIIVVEVLCHSGIGCFGKVGSGGI